MSFSMKNTEARYYMLLFSTLLEINDTLTKDAFIQLVLEWN